MANRTKKTITRAIERARDFNYLQFRYSTRYDDRSNPVFSLLSEADKIAKRNYLLQNNHGAHDDSAEMNSAKFYGPLGFCKDYLMNRFKSH
jgi:hypothetical protein